MTEEDEEALQRGEKFMVVGSLKPAVATLDLHVISVPKAKKKQKNETKEVTRELRTTFAATRGVK